MSNREKILIEKLEEATGKKVIIIENKDVEEPLLLFRQLYDKYQGIAGLESIILTQEFSNLYLGFLSRDKNVKKNYKYGLAVEGLNNQRKAKIYVESLKTLMGLALSQYPTGKKSNILEEENLFKPRRVEGRPITKELIFQEILTELDINAYFSETAELILKNLQEKFKFYNKEFTLDDLYNLLQQFTLAIKEYLEYSYEFKQKINKDK